MHRAFVAMCREGATVSTSNATGTSPNPRLSSTVVKVGTVASCGSEQQMALLPVGSGIAHLGLDARLELPFFCRPDHQWAYLLLEYVKKQHV
jgi:hypothetical protein